MSRRHSIDEEIESQCLARFGAFLERNGIRAEIIDCGSSTLTVAHAAEAVGCHTDDVLKTLLFHDGHGGFVIGIASGLSCVDRSLLASFSDHPKLKMASAEQVLHTLGYPAGGVPPLDLPPGMPVVADVKVAELEVCYAGAGTTRHLVRIDPGVILRTNSALVAPITAPPE